MINVSLLSIYIDVIMKKKFWMELAEEFCEIIGLIHLILMLIN